MVNWVEQKTKSEMACAMPVDCGRDIHGFTLYVPVAADTHTVRRSRRPPWIEPRSAATGYRVLNPGPGLR